MISENSLKDILQHDDKDDPRDINGDAPSWNKSYTGNSQISNRSAVDADIFNHVNKARQQRRGRMFLTRNSNLLKMNKCSQSYS